MVLLADSRSEISIQSNPIHSTNNFEGSTADESGCIIVDESGCRSMQVDAGGPRWTKVDAGERRWTKVDELDESGKRWMHVEAGGQNGIQVDSDRWPQLVADRQKWMQVDAGLPCACGNVLFNFLSFGL